MAALMWPVCAQERKTATLTRFADQVWRSVCDPILNEQAFEYPKGFPSKLVVNPRTGDACFLSGDVVFVSGGSRWWKESGTAVK